MVIHMVTVVIIGLLLIHEKSYEGALELFQHLSELEPGNTAVKQQVENLRKHVHRNKKAPSSPAARESSKPGTTTHS